MNKQKAIDFLKYQVDTVFIELETQIPFEDIKRYLWDEIDAYTKAVFNGGGVKELHYAEAYLKVLAHFIDYDAKQRGIDLDSDDDLDDAQLNVNRAADYLSLHE